MKLQLNDFIRRAAILICGTAFLACNNLDELEQRVDSLESRIQALETQLPALNENVTALSEILESGNISSVSINEETGEVTIITTGGNTYTFTQGSVGNAPKLSVDDEGYWIVSYDNWETEERILDQDGNPVPATSSSIVFGVSDDGYWEISYDGGETFVPVYKEDGTRIPALEEDSDFFKNIVYDKENQTLTLTLSDGKEIVINVVSDFLCQIQNVTYGEAETFSAGETRDFTVTMRGVATAEVTVPSGWKATLSDVADETATLSVTAPADGTSALTKITADTESDVTITAVSEKGLTAMAKMTVALSDTPAVSISAGEATSSTLTFTVTPNSHVTSFKYLLYDQDTAAPTDEAAFESATEVTANLSDPITLDRTSGASEANLTALTTYVLYVLPVGEGATYGSIRSCEATTADYNTYYERYEAGLDITVAGKTYNKNTYGEATLVSEDASITSTSGITKVFFVDNDATLTYNTTDAPSTEKAVYQLIIIGNTPGQRSSMLLNSQVALNQGAGNTDGTFVAYNLDIDATNAGNYLFAQNRDGAYGYVGFINCHFTMPSGKPFTYVSSSARSYAEFTVEDSEIEIPGTNQLLLFSFGSSTASHGTISLKNNVLYSENGVSDFRLISGNSCSFSNFVFENNTVVNLWSTTSGCVLYSSLNTVSVTKNLFWTDRTTANMAFFRPTDTGAGAGTPYTGNPTGTLVDDSIVYKNGEDTNWQWFYGGMNRVAKEGFESCNEIVASDTDPLATTDFENGIFTPNSTYSQYGAQRD